MIISIIFLLLGIFFGGGIMFISNDGEKEFVGFIIFLLFLFLSLLFGILSKV